jgi:hypothetical protein
MCPHTTSYAQPEPAALEYHEKMALVAETLHADGFNLRMLGHIRSKIKVYAHTHMYRTSGRIHEVLYICL